MYTSDRVPRRPICGAGTFAEAPRTNATAVSTPSTREHPEHPEHPEHLALLALRDVIGILLVVFLEQVDAEIAGEIRQTMW